MAEGSGKQDVNPGPPAFVTDGMRASPCSIAAALPRTQGLELLFGVPRYLDADCSRQGSHLTHRLLLDRAAATHLEEALTRVLGLPTDPGRLNGAKE